MNNNDVIAGIGAGGLQDKYDIKILICYLLYSIKLPFSKEQLCYVFQDENHVNYFSFCEALAELLQSGHITASQDGGDDLYTLNELGIDTAKKLNYALPKSLRDNVVETALRLLAKIKHEKENEVKIIPFNNGYNICCTIHDTDFDLMQLTVFVPDMLQAEKIKETFLRNPSHTYQGIIELLLDSPL